MRLLPQKNFSLEVSGARLVFVEGDPVTPSSAEALFLMVKFPDEFLPGDDEAVRLVENFKSGKYREPQKYGDPLILNF